MNLEYIVIQIYNEFKKKILYYYVIGMCKCFLWKWVIYLLQNPIKHNFTLVNKNRKAIKYGNDTANHDKKEYIDFCNYAENICTHYV